MKKLYFLIAAGLVALAISPVRGETKADTVLGALSNPTGLAVQPETGHVFVSDSAAGKVIRIADGKAEDVITGFPMDLYGKGPKYDIGPLGLAFVDKDTLVVGDGSFKDGEEYVRVFTVPAAGKPAINFDKDAKAKLGPLPDKDGLKAEGNFYAIAVGKTAIYVSSNGDDTKGWVLKADVNGTKFGELTRYIATKESVDVDAPVGITMSGEGDIVVGQMGEVNKPKDSLLTFYSAKTGKKLLNLETGLYDITGLAYSPKTKQLYALDFAWMSPADGGLYRLDKSNADGKQGLKATKILALDKPTALAFGKDGELYITVVGPKKESENAPKEGSLLKIAPGL
jgi:DNA-binding beta-propeller fold protein YncE